MADGIFLIFPVKRAAFLLSFPVWVYCFSVFAKTYTLSFFPCLFRFLCMFLFVILQLSLFFCKRLQVLNKKELLLTVLNHTERVLYVFVTSASLHTSCGIQAHLPGKFIVNFFATQIVLGNIKKQARDLFSLRYNIPSGLHSPLTYSSPESSVFLLTPFGRFPYVRRQGGRSEDKEQTFPFLPLEGALW